MPWRPLPRIAFGICIYPFQPSSTADLPLEIGDELYIIEQGGVDGAWYRGYLVAPPSLLAGLTSVKGQTLEARVFSGIFPRCCVEVREVLGDDGAGRRNGDTAEQLEEPIGKGGARGHDGERRLIGAITPTDSVTMAPMADSVTDQKTLHVFKTNSRPESGMSGSKSVSRPGRPDAKRTTSHGSWTASRSEQLTHSMLPLSPVSMVSPDPNSPKPLAPVPMLKIGDETPTSAQEPLVDEIASCLREWHSTKLHELLLSRRYSSLDRMWALVQRLDTARRQLLHKVLTAQELRRLRESTVWDLVAGNKMLSGEIIVRSPSQRGRILTADDSAIELTRLQSIMSLLDEKPTHPQDEHMLHHVLVDIKNFVGEPNQPTTIAMYLCIKDTDMTMRPVSEVYAVDLSARNVIATSTMDGNMRTLFVDLSAPDIGEGAGSGSTLYLVFKVLTNEPFRSRNGGDASLPAPGQTPSRQGTSLGHPSNPGSVKGGRRSRMWGSKGRKSSDVSVKSVEIRPIRKESTQSIEHERQPDSSNPQTPQSRDQKTVKRTVAAGVMEVNSLMKSNSEVEQEVILWTPVLPLEEHVEHEEAWDSFIGELFPSSTGAYRKLDSLNRLALHVKAFAHPDAESLIRKTPTLLHNVSQTRKIGFSGAPTKPRSDIYLTLSEPFLPRNALLSHPKTGTAPLTQTSGLANLQLTLEVRRSSGERIENCIYPSCNSAGHTAWRTTAVERGEAWNLTIRLAISPEDVPGSHIVMSIADAPGFPFALCWMPLWSQEAFVRDGDHSLALYKYDEYTSSMISGRGAYLALPWTVPKKDASMPGPLAALRLRTYLCSTQYSQDPILLGLLRWQEQGGENLVQLLKRFIFVPEIEIVKLLNQVFDALFETLIEYAGGEEYEDLVFSALVIVLGIVHDRRFNVAPLVDQYAETCFRYSLATSCLLRSFTRLLANPEDPDSSRKLRATFKVGAHVFKFIIHARQQEKEKEAGVGITSRQSAFVGDVQKIFQSLEALMKNQAPILIGTKTILVRNFHTWLSELSNCMSPSELAQIAANFIGACEHVQGKLILYKLVLIINLAHIDVLKLSDTRRLILSNIARWLDPYWGKTTMVTEQWKEQVRLCSSIVASQVNDLGQYTPHYMSKLVDSYRAIQASSHKPKKTLSLLFPTSYPFPTKPTSAEVLFDEALLEISAVLAAITSTSTGLDLNMQQAELAEFLFNVLQVYISVLDGEAFPSTWLSVHIYHHRSTMRALEKLSSVLIESLLPHPDDADQFNTELWRAFFDALLKLVGSDALALEVFPEQKRRAVWKIAGDVRELGADLLRRTWGAIGWDTNQDDRQRYGLAKMGGYQVQYVPGLVCPIVELCLSVHEGLRVVAVEVLQTMIISEWTLNQDLALIQAEIIDCLDRLFKTKDVTEAMLQKMFIGELTDLFEPLAQDLEDGLFVAVKDLIAVIDALLDLLAAVHSTEASGEIFHIMDTLHLMEFLKDMHKEDIYIRYVHQLAQLQAEARNYTEAGLALRLHADLYDWDPTTTVDALRDPEFPLQTSFERKEALYFQMIKYYEDGLSWDNALGSYTELATQYEHNVFDLPKLARTQRAMATIYESISKGERQNPRYFRVVYKGLGFPVGIRDKQFIFEGSPSDRLATFTDRMQQQHPSAQILAGSGEEDLEGQYLHIYPVSPENNLLHPIYQRFKVAQPIREHYLLSRLSSFTTTSRRQRSDVGAKELVVEKTVYTTAEAFPTILRRSEIIAVNPVTLSPIETAIERTTRKTAELIALEKRVADGEDAALASLTEALMLSVDSASDASVSHHRELLPQRRPSLVGEEAEEEPQLDPLETALQVALIDHALAVKHCLGLYSRPAQQATRADLTQRFKTTYAPELEILAPTTRASSHSPTTSWLAAPTQLIVGPQARPQSPQDIASQTSADISREKRSSRDDRNRLSPAFLKRGSMVDERESHQPNGSLDNVADKKRDASEGRSKERDRNRLSFLYSPASEDPSRQNSGSLRPNSFVSETPETGMSDHSGGQNIGDRGGSVKKRLNLLNIGKTASKYSVRSRVERSG